MAWVTWRQNRIQFVAGGIVLLAVALLAAATGPVDPSSVRPAGACDVSAAGLAVGLRHHRAALPE